MTVTAHGIPAAIPVLLNLNVQCIKSTICSW